jgi:hypothetical protein
VHEAVELALVSDALQRREGAVERVGAARGAEGHHLQRAVGQRRAEAHER